MATRSKSKRLIKLYRAVYFHKRAIDKLTACYRIEEETGEPWDEEERKNLHEAVRDYESARKRYDDLMAARIGKAVTSEIRYGEWK